MATRRVRAALAASVVALLITSVGFVGAQDTMSPPRIVILARQDVAADALSASPVAAQFAGIVLITASDALLDEARQGILQHDADLVILAGGTDALSADVEQQVRALGVEVRRVGGGSRAETSRLLALLLEDYGRAFLAVDGTARDSERLQGERVDEVIARASGEQGPAGPPGAQGGSGPRQVIVPFTLPLGGYAACPDAYDVMTYCDEAAAPVSMQTIMGDAYPAGTTAVLDIGFRVSRGERACARLRRLPATVVEQSEVCVSGAEPSEDHPPWDGDYVRERSATFALPGGSQAYVVETLCVDGTFMTEEPWEPTEPDAPTESESELPFLLEELAAASADEFPSESETPLGQEACYTGVHIAQIVLALP